MFNADLLKRLKQDRSGQSFYSFIPYCYFIFFDLCSYVEPNVLVSRKTKWRKYKRIDLLNFCETNRFRKAKKWDTFKVNVNWHYPFSLWIKNASCMRRFTLFWSIIIIYANGTLRCINNIVCFSSFINMQFTISFTQNHEFVILCL